MVFVPNITPSEQIGLNKGDATASRGAGAYYRPELDALRFFAFLCVFAFHRMDYVGTDAAKDLWGFRIGTVGAFGVPVFFLLSAFLITELLVRERERTGKVHIGSFYVRRILRIWPLYFAVFFGLILLNHFVPGVSTTDKRAWAAFSFFTGNWYITWHGWIAGSVDPLWSISVEEQFYIAIPLLAALGGRRVLFWTCSVLLAVSYATVFWYALHQTPADAGEWTNSFVHFQFFAAGTLLALLLRGRVPQFSAPVRVGGFVLGFVCWFTAMIDFRVQSWNPQPTPVGSLAGWLLVLAGACLFFLSALGASANSIPRPLAYFGRISYGLYVFHSLIFFLLFEKLAPHLHSMLPSVSLPLSVAQNIGTVLVLLCSLLLAHFSFRYFERPFLRLKSRFTFVASREEVSAEKP